MQILIRVAKAYVLPVLLKKKIPVEFLKVLVLEKKTLKLSLESSLT